MTCLLLCKFSIFLAFPSLLLGITTVHHDKPEESRIEKMATKMRQEAPVNTTTLNSERQKRLLPYINYYLGSNNNYQRPLPQSNYQQQKTHQYVEYSPELVQREKFTPFLESNAIPGAFTPMVQVPQKNIETGFINAPTRQQKLPNYGSIYEKLAQLKLAQQVDPYLQNYKISHGKPQDYVHNHYDNQYKIVQPDKTIIETYTPTNIDISNNGGYGAKPNHNENLVYQVYQPKPQVQQQEYLVEVPRPRYSNPQYDQPAIVNSNKQYYGEKIVVRKPVVFYQQKQFPKIQQEDNRDYLDAQIAKPIILTPIKSKPSTVTTIIDDNYVAQKFTPVQEVQIKPYSPSPVQFVPQRYEPKYEEIYYRTPAPVEVSTEPTNSLSLILKQLQDSNALPHTLTPDNIDNSIKTLVRILSALKTQQKLYKPVEDHVEVENQNDFVQPPAELAPGTVTQNFPADTVEGGTPGRPGVDYPALSTIPQTSFNCKTQRYKGFFGDPHTNCQVWHYCDLNGGQASFLCPNGTIFSQVALTCDWWYNVKCAITTQLYVLNERLYKYILPLSPKFPEDYSGPLVDKYIALKFKEMEEKMRKEKKNKPKKDQDEEEDKDDSDQLLDIQSQNQEATSSEAT